MRYSNASLNQVLALDLFDGDDEEESEVTKTAADEFDANGGFFKALMQWLRGHDRDTIPSWFPKRLLLPEEIATRRWIESGPAWAGGTLGSKPDQEKAAARRVEGAWGIFRMSDKTPVYGPVDRDAVEMAMESGRYPAGQFYAATMPDVGAGQWEGNPFADVEVKGESPYLASVAAREAKIAEIAVGLLTSNPHLHPKAARKLAVETVHRFPQMVAAAPKAGPEARERAYQRQQEESRSRRDDATQRMKDTYQRYKDAGDDEKAEFWADMLRERGVEVP
jgi:hypothetical protein